MVLKLEEAGQLRASLKSFPVFGADLKSYVVFNRMWSAKSGVVYRLKGQNDKFNCSKIG